MTDKEGRLGHEYSVRTLIKYEVSEGRVSPSLIWKCRGDRTV